MFTLHNNSDQPNLNALYMEISKAKEKRESISTNLRNAREKLDEAVTDLVDAIHKWKNESVILNKLTEVLVDAYIRTDKQGVITGVNPSACRLLEVEKTDVLGKHINMFFLENFVEVVNKGQFINQQIQNINGVVTLVSTSITETPTDYVFLIREVELNKRKETEIHLITQALDTVTDSILIADSHNRIIFTNKTFTIHTGYENAEVVGKFANFLRAEKDFTLEKEIWSKLMQKKTWEGNIKNKSKSGALLNDYTVITPIMSKEVDVPAFFLYIKRFDSSKGEK